MVPYADFLNATLENSIGGNRNPERCPYQLMNFYAITIPVTSMGRYLGGMSALNLPSPAGTGDWHMTETFFVPRKKRPLSFICGDGCPVNTNHMFGNAGIYDCTRILDELKIGHEGTVAYAASHARAIVDLVVGAILRGQSTDYVVLEDWMPGLEDKQEVYDLLRMADRYLSVDQDEALRVWLQKNSSLFYDLTASSRMHNHD